MRVPCAALALDVTNSKPGTIQAEVKMNENESIKYNREIMFRKIRYRAVLFWALFFIGLLLTNIFIDDKNIKGVLIGAILSLLITTIYSLVDIYIKVFEDIDSQRIQFFPK